MTKAQLIEFIQEETGLDKNTSAKALEAVMNGITKGLKKEGKVTLTGFATFTAKHKEAKVGRNPRTGEAVKIAARTVCTVKAGSKLKDALN